MLTVLASTTDWGRETGDGALPPLLLSNAILSLTFIVDRHTKKDRAAIIVNQ